VTETRPSFLRRHAEWLFWIALFAVLIGYRWPVLKGYVYKATGTTPPGAAFIWRTDLPAALAEAKATGRPVLVDFYADWCPPCIAMKHDVWPDAEVGRALTARYIPVQVDVDRDPAAAARYRIEGIPTVLVLDAEGEVLREAQFLSRGGLLAFLQDE
jgi:thiol:disulfide interchange protein